MTNQEKIRADIIAAQELRAAIAEEERKNNPRPVPARAAWRRSNRRNFDQPEPK